jgi:hypothetical protein
MQEPIRCHCCLYWQPYLQKINPKHRGKNETVADVDNAAACDIGLLSHDLFLFATLVDCQPDQYSYGRSYTKTIGFRHSLTDMAP